MNINKNIYENINIYIYTCLIDHSPVNRYIPTYRIIS